MEEFKCKGCDYDLTELASKSANGLVKCPHCGAVRTVPKKEITPAALSFLKMGEHDLDTCKFDEAYEAYKKASELDKNEPEAYWGMALAKFKVQYLKDEVNNCLQPICHEVTDKKFTDDPDCMRAFMKATPEQREEYEKRAKDIDYIQNEFSKLEETGLDYDCFICVKVTGENGNTTEDSKGADYIYRLLKDKGYKPFYSEYEIRNKQGADYEAHILYALYKSECMLVVCRDESYLQTKWVKNEYARFLKLVNDEERESDSITIVYSGKPIERLPGKKGKIQGIDFSRREADGQITEFVERHTPIAKKKREEAAAAKLRREEENQRRYAEQQHLFEKQQREMEERQKAFEEQRRIEREETEKQRRAVEEQQRQIAELIEKMKSKDSGNEKDNEAAIADLTQKQMELARKEAELARNEAGLARKEAEWKIKMASVAAAPSYTSDTSGATRYSSSRSKTDYKYSTLSLKKKLLYSLFSILSVMIGFSLGLSFTGGSMGSSGALGVLVTFGGLVVIIASLIFTLIKIWKKSSKRVSIYLRIVLNGVIAFLWVILHLIII